MRSRFTLGQEGVRAEIILFNAVDSMRTEIF